MYGYGGSPNYGVRLSDDELNLALERTGSDYRVGTQQQPMMTGAGAPPPQPQQQARSSPFQTGPGTGLVDTGRGQVIAQRQPAPAASQTDAGAAGRAGGQMGAGGMGGVSPLMQNALQNQNPTGKGMDSKHGTMNAGQGMDVMGLFTKLFGF